MIKDFVEQVKKGSVDVLENTHKTIDEIKKINKTHNFMNVICEDQSLTFAKQRSRGRLEGLPITIKDNICVKDVESTAGSKILKGYKPVFNAAVIQKLLDEGAVIIGKTSMDEFGFGSFNKNVGIDYKTPLNPLDKERVTGGSSGGSAGITKSLELLKKEHFSLGESTGGSIECPSSFCGTVGFCPTYGLISRNGLISYANSLDKIGPITISVEDAALIMEIISGNDPKDSTSSLHQPKKYSDYIKKPVKGLTIGIVKEFVKGLDKGVEKNFWNTIKKLETQGAKYKKISLPITAKYSLSTYYILAMCEASTNLSCLSGLRYGVEEDVKGKNYNEYFSRIRGQNFGSEAKRRIMLGTFARMAGYREQYYLKATKVRTLIIEEYKKALKNCDILSTPTMPTIAPKIKEVERLTPLQNYLMDVLTVGPNLAGIPHCSVPNGFDKGMPTGIMFVADHFEEEKVFQIASKIEEKNE